MSTQSKVVGIEGLKDVIEFKERDFYLGEDHPVLPYRNNRPLTGVHWGQVKLMGTELLFLTEYYDPSRHKNPVGVYAGAAGGHHIPLLAVLFPAFRWELYDPAKFAIEETDRLTIHNGLFTNEVAEGLHQRSKEEKWDLFFISDIRIVPNRKGASAEELATMKEDRVSLDMRYQEQWHRILKPFASLLKFRFPFNITEKAELFSYLPGRIMIQPYPGHSSTETRLIVTDPEPKNVDYDSRWYEQALAYHNAVDRQFVPYASTYDPKAEGIAAPRVLGNYDGAWFATAIERYLTKIHRVSKKAAEPSENNVRALITEIFDHLSEAVYTKDRIIQKRIERLREVRSMIEGQIEQDLPNIRDRKARERIMNRPLYGGGDD